MLLILLLIGRDRPLDDLLRDLPVIDVECPGFDGDRVCRSFK